MMVLGLDPGTHCFGYGLIEKVNHMMCVKEYGVIKAKHNEPLSVRIAYMFAELERFIHRVGPEAISLEKVFFGVNVKSAISLGEARGIALLAAQRSGVKIVEFSPTQIKQAVTGQGRAHKTQVQHMVKQVLRLKQLPQPSDAADALAAAYCYFNHHAMATLMATL